MAAAPQSLQGISVNYEQNEIADLDIAVKYSQSRDIPYSLLYRFPHGIFFLKINNFTLIRTLSVADMLLIQAFSCLCPHTDPT
jgi:hypothetical protein